MFPVTGLKTSRSSDLNREYSLNRGSDFQSPLSDVLGLSVVFFWSSRSQTVDSLLLWKWKIVPPFWRENVSYRIVKTYTVSRTKRGWTFVTCVRGKVATIFTSSCPSSIPQDFVIGVWVTTTHTVSSLSSVRALGWHRGSSPPTVDVSFTSVFVIPVTTPPPTGWRGGRQVEVGPTTTTSYSQKGCGQALCSMRRGTEHPRQRHTRQRDRVL